MMAVKIREDPVLVLQTPVVLDRCCVLDCRHRPLLLSAISRGGEGAEGRSGGGAERRLRGRRCGQHLGCLAGGRCCSREDVWLLRLDLRCRGISMDCGGGEVSFSSETSMMLRHSGAAAHSKLCDWSDADLCFVLALDFKLSSLSLTSLRL